MCEDEATKELQQSFGRKKRSNEGTNSKNLELQTGDVVTDITMETLLFVVSNGKHSKQSTPYDAHHKKVAEKPGKIYLCIHLFLPQIFY